MTDQFPILGQVAPTLRTQKVLIIIDVQTDFSNPRNRYSVYEDVDFMENIRHIVPLFRTIGTIFWICHHVEVPIRLMFNILLLRS